MAQIERERRRTCPPTAVVSEITQRWLGGGVCAPHRTSWLALPALSGDGHNRLYTTKIADRLHRLRVTRLPWATWLGWCKAALPDPVAAHTRPRQLAPPATSRPDCAGRASGVPGSTALSTLLQPPAPPPNREPPACAGLTHPPIGCQDKLPPLALNAEGIASPPPSSLPSTTSRPFLHLAAMASRVAPPPPPPAWALPPLPVGTRATIVRRPPPARVAPPRG